MDEFELKEYKLDVYAQLTKAFDTLVHNNEVDDYNAVRPLYGIAHRIFECGISEAKLNNWKFRQKLKLFEKFLDVELINSETKVNHVENINIITWTYWGNGIPHWIRIGIQPYIGHWVDEIDDKMSSLNRPCFWSLLKGDFGKNAQKKALLAIANKY